MKTDMNMGFDELRRRVTELCKPLCRSVPDDFHPEQSGGDAMAAANTVRLFEHCSLSRDYRNGGRWYVYCNRWSIIGSQNSATGTHTLYAGSRELATHGLGPPCVSLAVVEWCDNQQEYREFLSADVSKVKADIIQAFADESAFCERMMTQDVTIKIKVDVPDRVTWRDRSPLL